MYIELAQQRPWESDIGRALVLDELARAAARLAADLGRTPELRPALAGRSLLKVTTALLASGSAQCPAAFRSREPTVVRLLVSVGVAHRRARATDLPLRPA
jgi:hypothetical protein